MKKVGFDIRYALRQPESKGDNFQPRYQACIEQCAFADKIGFSTVMLSEHHGSPDGYMCSPMVLGAAVAAVTKQLRIQFGSLIGPLHEPVRLAEDLATLDIISNGRVEPCISGGYVGYEFEMLGTSLTNRKSYMDEIVPFLRNAWTGEPFEWNGRRICIRPRPVQRPGPPIIMGGTSKVAARRAARDADVFWPPAQKFMETYYEELEKLGKKPGGKMPKRFLVWLAEDPEKYWAEYGPSALHENNAYGKWHEDWKAFNGYFTKANTEELRETGLYPVLTPQQLVDKLKQSEGDMNVMLHPMAGGPDPDLAWKMLELVANKVIPMIKSEGMEYCHRFTKVYR